MSHTYTSRPTATRTGGGRGRGRGRGTKTQSQNTTREMQGQGHTLGGARPRPGASRNGYNNPAGATNDTSTRQEGEAGGNTEAGLQGRIQRRDAYSVIPPNEKKRAEIAKQARQEEEAYKRHKEGQKLGRVSYVGTAGGGEMSETESRKKSQQKQTNSTYERRMKSQQYKEEQRKRENDEYEKKKAVARRKAEQNKLGEAKRETSLQEDHRRKNEEFLARLEKESKEKQREKKLSKQTQQPPRSQPVETYESEDDFDEYEVRGAQGGPNLPSTNQSVDSTSSPLRELRIYFPSYDPEYLEDILLQVNGDIDMAKHLLSS